MTDPLSVMQLDFSEDDIPWTEGKHFYRLWCSLRGTNRWPSRKQLKPIEMREYLEDIMLIDVRDDPLDFVVRLSGTGYNRFLPHDPTGESIVTFNNGEAVFTRFSKMLALEKPYLGLNQPVPWADKMKEYSRFDGMVLPLGDDNNQINILMLLVNYH